MSKAYYVKVLLEEKALLESKKSAHSIKLLDDEIERIRNGGDEPIRKPQFKEDSVKISEIVIFPVNEYPQFDFMKKLLGPKGDKLEGIEAATQSKISIIGQSFAKEGIKKEFSGNDNSDPLCLRVEVEGPKSEAYERMASALIEIKEIVEVEDDMEENPIEVITGYGRKSGSNAPNFAVSGFPAVSMINDNKPLEESREFFRPENPDDMIHIPPSAIYHEQQSIYQDKLRVDKGETSLLSSVSPFIDNFSGMKYDTERIDNWRDSFHTPIINEEHNANRDRSQIEDREATPSKNRSYSPRYFDRSNNSLEADIERLLESFLSIQYKDLYKDQYHSSSRDRVEDKVRYHSSGRDQVADKDRYHSSSRDKVEDKDRYHSSGRDQVEDKDRYHSSSRDQVEDKDRYHSSSRDQVEYKDQYHSSSRDISTQHGNRKSTYKDQFEDHSDKYKDQEDNYTVQYKDREKRSQHLSVDKEDRYKDRFKDQSKRYKDQESNYRDRSKGREKRNPVRSMEKDGYHNRFRDSDDISKDRYTNRENLQKNECKDRETRYKDEYKDREARYKDEYKDREGRYKDEYKDREDKYKDRYKNSDDLCKEHVKIREDRFNDQYESLKDRYEERYEDKVGYKDQYKRDEDRYKDRYLGRPKGQRDDMSIDDMSIDQRDCYRLLQKLLSDDEIKSLVSQRRPEKRSATYSNNSTKISRKNPGKDSPHFSSGMARCDADRYKGRHKGQREDKDRPIDQSDCNRLLSNDQTKGLASHRRGEKHNATYSNSSTKKSKKNPREDSPNFSSGIAKYDIF